MAPLYSTKPAQTGTVQDWAERLRSPKNIQKNQDVESLFQERKNDETKLNVLVLCNSNKMRTGEIGLIFSCTLLFSASPVIVPYNFFFLCCALRASSWLAPATVHPSTVAGRALVGASVRGVRSAWGFEWWILFG